MPVTRKFLLAALSVAGSIILALIGAIYLGLKDEAHDLRTDVQQIQTALQEASKSAGRFDAALSRAPDLEKTIRETHEAVMLAGTKLTDLSTHLDRIDTKVDQLQNDVRRIDSNLQRAPWILRPEQR
jgi:uncharacterized protein HemX